jgi:leucyl aminopeptidase
MRLTLLLPALAAAIASTSAAPALPFSVEVPSLGIFSRFFSSLHPLLEPALVQSCHECTPYWTNELGKHWLFLRGIKYFDITSEYYKGPLPLHISSEAEFPSKLSYEKKLKGTIFDEISEKGPRENLKKFTSFRTRYYRSATGRESQLWLMGTAKLIASSRQDLNITVNELKHSWGQNSIILHIPGQGSKAVKEEGVTILGAHQDSTNLIPFLAAPGADDDGSGTVTLLEALRALLKTGWTPRSDVEFHWYSAEEGGLLGSQEVVRAYMENGIKVKAMLQQDMTAFVKAGTKERVGLVTDFTNAKLTTFIALLIDTYLNIPYAFTKIGYSASDHGSWNKAGVPSAFAIESEFADCNTQNIHSTRDTMDLPEFSFSHMMQFVRLSTSFVVELAGWEGK